MTTTTRAHGTPSSLVDCRSSNTVGRTVLIGILTAVGLFLLDVPLALTLGLIAGLLAFVPFFGPIAFGVLAVVLTFTQGPQQALYVALLCFAIQQIDGYSSCR